MIKNRQIIILLIIFSLMYIFKTCISCNNKYKEHFSIGTKKSITKTINDTINKTITDSLMKTTQKCQNKLSVNQNMNYECNAHESTIAKYAELQGECVMVTSINKTDSSACADLKPCVFKDISQEAVVTFKGSCDIDQNMVTDMQKAIKDTLIEKIKSEDDAFGSAIKSIASGLADASFGGSTTKNEVINKIVNESANSITIESVQEMVNQFSVNQDISFKGTSGLMQGITQSARLDIIADMMNKSEQRTNLIEAIENLEDIDKEEKTKGVTDALGDFFDSLTTGWIVAIVGGVILLLGLVYMGPKLVEIINATGDAVEKNKLL